MRKFLGELLNTDKILRKFWAEFRIIFDKSQNFWVRFCQTFEQDFSKFCANYFEIFRNFEQINFQFLSKFWGIFDKTGKACDNNV